MSEIEQSTRSVANKRKTSWLAKWAIVVLIAGPILIILGQNIDEYTRFFFYSACVSWIIAPLLGVAGLIHILRNKIYLTGIPQTLAAILIPTTFFLIYVPLLRWGLQKACLAMCQTNMKGLDKAIEMYSTEYGGTIPIADHWCDLLVKKADMNFGCFRCKARGSLVGESNYAFNRNINGWKLKELPPNIVVLFECDYVEDFNNLSDANIPVLEPNTCRAVAWQGGIKIIEVNDGYKMIKAGKVCKHNWNQTGGAEMLSTKNHLGKGCNVLFADGTIRFIKPKEISGLKWKP